MQFFSKIIHMKRMTNMKVVSLDEEHLSLEEVQGVGERRARVKIFPGAGEKVRRSRDFVEEALRRGEKI